VDAGVVPVLRYPEGGRAVLVGVTN
jgi:hypothetical protein